MSAVNWTDPSEGHVSDPKPALTLINNKDGALVAKSRGMVVFALSPRNTAVVGGNQRGIVPAIGGVSAADSAASSILTGIGVLGVTDRGAATGVAGVAFRERSIGVLGEAENASIGVVGRGGIAGVEGTSRNGTGVGGFTQSKGDEAGVYGRASGAGGAGVRGVAVAGPGVEGYSSAGPGLRASSDQAQGVVGEAKASNAAGVFGRNDNSSGVGVDGYSNAGTAVRAMSSNGDAVHAETVHGTAITANTLDGPFAIDAYSLASPALNALSGGVAVVANGVKAGVYATAMNAPGSDPKEGAAMQGANLLGDGVKGVSFSGVGVRGVGHPKLGAWAGVFEGNVVVTGLLLKAASLFSIDHPLEPDRRVLNHASVEAPEYKTFYDGVATLDAAGRARVQLPRWFAALNGGVRHQLTPMGAPAPDLHVRSAKKDSFVVAGGRPGQKVCWQVTGVRRDAWARAHPLEVEQAKRAARPKTAPTTEADLRRLRASLEKDAQEFRDKGGRSPRAGGSGLRPTRVTRPPITREAGAQTGSRTTEQQARSLLTAAKKAMKK